uniref:Uncharacterized protein n=1 Tax=Anopheles atroparvus TaxID=41427 RepID=A0AAG5DU30_ANOAO
MVLEDQGINVNLPDEALQLVKPKIAVSDDTLLYILQVPQLEKEVYDLLQIHPLNVNDSIISQYPALVIKGKRGIFTSTTPDEYIQRPGNIRQYEDDCISNLLEGKKSSCKTKSANSTVINTIAEGTLLINNAKNESLKFNCGPDEKIITGNYLIRFTQCTVNIQNLSFQSTTTIDKTEPFWGAVSKTTVTLQPTELQDQANFINRIELHHAYLKKFNSHWNFSLLGGISCSLILTVALAFFAVVFYQRKVRAIAEILPRKNDA